MESFIILLHFLQKPLIYKALTIIFAQTDPRALAICTKKTLNFFILCAHGFKL